MDPRRHSSAGPLCILGCSIIPTGLSLPGEDWALPAPGPAPGPRRPLVRDYGLTAFLRPRAAQRPHQGASGCFPCPTPIRMLAVMGKVSYRDAGLDLDVYEQSLACMAPLLKRTHTPRV